MRDLCLLLAALIAIAALAQPGTVRVDFKPAPWSSR